MKLSGSQRFIKWFSSASRFEKIMAESKQWKFTCKHCGQVSSIWDAGGIRYKAAGKPTTLVKCIHCGKTGMHSISKDPA
jgi:RNase P subunit RPR2